MFVDVLSLFPAHKRREKKEKKRRTRRVSKKFFTPQQRQAFFYLCVCVCVCDFSSHPLQSCSLFFFFLTHSSLSTIFFLVVSFVCVCVFLIAHRTFESVFVLVGIVEIEEEKKRERKNVLCVLFFPQSPLFNYFHHHLRFLCVCLFFFLFVCLCFFFVFSSLLRPSTVNQLTAF